MSKEWDELEQKHRQALSSLNKQIKIERTMGLIWKLILVATLTWIVVKIS